MGSTAAIRTYTQPDAVVFLKTKEAFGGLSNMASGYPLLVNGIRILSSEALYQACRFPYLPDVQGLIIQQKSPMTAKMVSKPYLAQSRPDWERVRVKIMRWCLRVKLAQNRQSFGKLLLETGDLPIVEKSFKDEYWGAKPTYANRLVGMNVLGRLLMELREELKSGVFDTKDWLEAPAIPDFLLDGKPIEIITINQKAFTLSPQPSLFEPMPIIAPETTITTTMQTFPQYATYKDSGIEWLGKIPEHWKIFPLKRALNGCTNGLWGSDPKGLCDITVLRVADFDRQKLIVSDEKLTIRSIPIKDRENRLLKKGDLLIEKSGGGEKTLVGCVVYFDKEYEAITSNFVAKITPKSDFDGRFLNYAFSTLYSLRVNYLSIKQTTGIQNLDTESYFKESFAFPTETEQTAIANFLDQKTAQIDAAIAIKEQQIALLKERKQIIIQQAVTQGLDPNVPMKDSGVEWIGEIPAHWEVKKLRYTSGK